MIDNPKDVQLVKNALKELEVPIFSEDDIMLVCQQANCDEEKAKDALAETKGDIAQAILRLTSG